MSNSKIVACLKWKRLLHSSSSYETAGISSLAFLLLNIRDLVFLYYIINHLMDYKCFTFSCSTLQSFQFPDPAVVCLVSFCWMIQPSAMMPDSRNLGNHRGRRHLIRLQMSFKIHLIILTPRFHTHKHLLTCPQFFYLHHEEN